MSECEQLDAYLSNDLSDHAAAQFCAHLAECETCNTLIDEQRWIDRLLQDTATTTAVPVEVWTGIDQRIARSKRRRRLAGGAAALTLAASLLVALSLRSPISDPKTHPAPAAHQVSQPVATFVGSKDMIVVQHQNPFPNVTFVEVYPTFTARRHQQHKSQTLNVQPQSTTSPKHIFGEPS